MEFIEVQSEKEDLKSIDDGEDPRLLPRSTPLSSDRRDRGLDKSGDSIFIDANDEVGELFPTENNDPFTADLQVRESSKQQRQTSGFYEKTCEGRQRRRSAICRHTNRPHIFLSA